MNLFSVAVMYIVVFISSIISCRFLVSFSSSQNKPQYYLIYITLNILVNYLFFSIPFYIPEIVNQFSGIIIVFVFCHFVLKADSSTALFTSILNVSILGIYNIVAFSVSGILFRETQISEYLINILGSASILILSAVTFEVFIKRFSKHKIWSKSYSVIYICPLAFICFVTQTLMNIAYNPVTVVNNRVQYSTSTSQDLEVLFVIGICLVSIYVILYFYEKVLAQIETQNKMSALEAYTEMQKQYINEAKQKYENTKAFRHDVHNHMLTLAGLIQSNETEKVKEYLERFNNETTKLFFEVFTGNSVIDVLFKEKFGFAREQGIKIMCDASIPKDFIVEDFDLCIIFFNALDNAIKGCEFAKEKFIDVAAKKNKEFFVIDIMNSFNPQKYDKGLGIGLETIKFITEKYGGYLEISTDTEIFRVSIMFSLK